MNLWYVDSSGSGSRLIRICSSKELYPSIAAISASLFLSDSHCVAYRKEHHGILHPLWSVLYIICAWPLGANLGTKSIFIHSSYRWCPIVSNPVMVILCYSDASNIILLSSESATPYISNHSCPVWYFWTTLCQDMSLASCLSFQYFLIRHDFIDLLPVPFYSLF